MRASANLSGPHARDARAPNGLATFAVAPAGEQPLPPGEFAHAYARRLATRRADSLAWPLFTITLE